MLPALSCFYKIDTIDLEGVEPHTHSVTSEIIQCFSNNGRILIDNTLYNMQSNGLYFINGLTTHFIVPDDINRYSHTILVLSTNELQKICSNLKMSQVYEKIFTKNGGTFCELPPKQVIETDKTLLEIADVLNENDDGMQYAKLSALLIKLLETGNEYSAKKDTSNSKISDILSYISENALSKITIEDICKETHISKFHLCHIFKENMGVTIGNFIKSRRLSVAKQLLIETNNSITTIAQKCGFSDGGFFGKTFAKEFGYSPTEFRKKYR